MDRGAKTDLDDFIHTSEVVISKKCVIRSLLPPSPTMLRLKWTPEDVTQELIETKLQETRYTGTSDNGHCEESF